MNTEITNSVISNQYSLEPNGEICKETLIDVTMTEKEISGSQLSALIDQNKSISNLMERHCELERHCKLRELDVSL